MTGLVLTAFIILSGILSVPYDHAHAEKELEALQGVWMLRRCEDKDKIYTSDELYNAQFVLKGDFASFALFPGGAKVGAENVTGMKLLHFIVYTYHHTGYMWALYDNDG